MPLASTADLVTSAARDRHGVGAFNVVQLEHADAIVSGAAQADAPVILQVSQNTARYHGGLEQLALATLSIARRTAVPVAVHLDHAETPELVGEAVRLGFGSVMFDASRLPYEANLAATAEVAARCHAAGVWVEAELGEVGGEHGAHAPGPAPTRRRRPASWPRPRWTRWPWPRAARTPCSPGTPGWTSTSSGGSPPASRCRWSCTAPRACPTPT